MTASILKYRQQSGSILVQFALLLGIIVAILGVLDIGYMYYAKRELQRTADLAALSAVQAINFGDDNASQRALRCDTAGVESVNANWPASSPLVPVIPIAESVSCGEWNTGFDDEPYFFSTSSSEVNAAHVKLKGRSPTFIPAPWRREIKAEAIAKRGEPQAAFSVGSKLLTLGKCGQGLEGLDALEQLLSFVGVRNSCVVLNGYEGLVNLEVKQGMEGGTLTPMSLLKALNLPVDINMTVLDVNNLLAAEKVSLGSLLDAAAIAGGEKGLLAANTTLLNALGAKLGINAFALEIPLGSSPVGPGLFASIYAPDEENASALGLNLSVIDIITTAVGIATSRRGVDVKELGMS